MPDEPVDIAAETLPAAAPKKLSLAEVREQEKFESEEGVWMQVNLFGCYVGKLLVTYIASEELFKKHRDLQKRWRIKNSKPKDYDLTEEENEPLWRQSLIGTVVHAHDDFESEPGVPYPQSGLRGREAHDSLHRLLDEYRTIRGALNAFVVDRSNYDRRALEALQEN